MSDPSRETPVLPLDPVIEAYKAGVDITLLRENLKLTPSGRVEKALAFAAAMEAIRGKARKPPQVP